MERKEWGKGMRNNAAIVTSEVGIYKRKQESKKTRKHELDQESDQENKKTRTRLRQRPRKKGKTFFFLDHFLGRVFYKFPPLVGICGDISRGFLPHKLNFWNCNAAFAALHSFFSVYLNNYEGMVFSKGSVITDAYNGLYDIYYIIYYILRIDHATLTISSRNV